MNYGTEVRNRPKRHDARQYTPVLRYLLTPVALSAYSLALWRLAADLNLAGDFFISSGPLSRWQVWLALAIATQFGGRRLERSDREGGAPTPSAGL